MISVEKGGTDMDFGAALFDLDGTLIDSKGVWARIDAEFLLRRGITPPDDYMKAVSSKKFSEAAVYTIARFGLDDTVEGLSAEWLEMARHEYGTNIFLKPGAADYLRALKKAGVRLGTVSGLPHALSDAVLEHNGVRELFDAFISEFESIYSISVSGASSAPQANEGGSGLPSTSGRRLTFGVIIGIISTAIVAFTIIVIIIIIAIVVFIIIASLSDAGFTGRTFHSSSWRC